MDRRARSPAAERETSSQRQANENESKRRDPTHGDTSLICCGTAARPRTLTNRDERVPIRGPRTEKQCAFRLSTFRYALDRRPPNRYGDSTSTMAKSAWSTSPPVVQLTGRTRSVTRLPSANQYPDQRGGISAEDSPSAGSRSLTIATKGAISTASSSASSRVAWAS